MYVNMKELISIQYLVLKLRVIYKLESSRECPFLVRQLNLYCLLLGAWNKCQPEEISQLFVMTKTAYLM